jgi:hypothetical protein
VGARCFAACERDAECRTDDGFVCDPHWRACVLPNVAVIVPAACPADSQAPALPGRAAPAKGSAKVDPPPPARDAAFGPSAAWSGAATPGLAQREPAAAITAGGGVTALFLAHGATSADGAIESVRVDASGAASLARPLATGRVAHAAPALARDRADTLYAVWLERTREHGDAIALAISRDAGTTWSEPAWVHAPEDCASVAAPCLAEPRVVVGPDPSRLARDVVYVLYAAGRGGLRVRASRDGGKTFGPAVTALGGGRGNATVSGDGKLHVIAHGGDELDGFGSAQHAIAYAMSADAGATFTAAVPASGRLELLPYYFANPSIAVDHRRKWVYAAYVRGGRDARWDLVLAASKDGGKTFKRTKLAGDGCAIHMVPHLALDPRTGTLHVAWYDSRGAGGRFARASCTPGAARCTQHGAINSVPFAALTTARHGQASLGERQSLLVDEPRRRLHAVWTQPVEEDGQIRTRIFHATARLKP